MQLSPLNLLMGQFDTVSAQAFVGPEQSIGARIQIVRSKNNSK